MKSKKIHRDRPSQKKTKAYIQPLLSSIQKKTPMLKAFSMFYTKNIKEVLHHGQKYDPERKTPKKLADKKAIHWFLILQKHQESLKGALEVFVSGIDGRLGIKVTCTKSTLLDVLPKYVGVTFKVPETYNQAHLQKLSTSVIMDDVEGNMILGGIMSLMNMERNQEKALFVFETLTKDSPGIEYTATLKMFQDIADDLCLKKFDLGTPIFIRLTLNQKNKNLEKDWKNWKIKENPELLVYYSDAYKNFLDGKK